MVIDHACTNRQRKRARRREPRGYSNDTRKVENPFDGIPDQIRLDIAEHRTAALVDGEPVEIRRSSVYGTLDLIVGVVDIRLSASEADRLFPSFCSISYSYY